MAPYLGLRCLPRAYAKQGKQDHSFVFGQRQDFITMRLTPPYENSVLKMAGRRPRIRHEYTNSAPRISCIRGAIRPPWPAGQGGRPARGRGARLYALTLQSRLALRRSRRPKLIPAYRFAITHKIPYNVSPIPTNRRQEPDERESNLNYNESSTESGFSEDGWAG